MTSFHEPNKPSKIMQKKVLAIYLITVKWENYIDSKNLKFFDKRRLKASTVILLERQMTNS